MSMRSIPATLAWLASCLFLALPAEGGSFGVAPIRVELDRTTRTGQVTVSNDDTRRLGFQVKLMAWTQDEQGVDAYAESSELIFFPQIMTIEPGDKRVIRIGSRGGDPTKEKAYRLFIEELQDPAAAEARGAQVAVVLRFGVPVFVNPSVGTASPEFVMATLARGKIEVRIRNTGARHVRFEQVSVRAGSEVLGTTGGWYVFPGSTRAFEIPIPADKCRTSGQLEIGASVEGREIKHAVEAGPTLCAP